MHTFKNLLDMGNNRLVTLNPSFKNLSVGKNKQTKTTTTKLKWGLNLFYYSKPQDA